MMDIINEHNIYHIQLYFSRLCKRDIVSAYVYPISLNNFRSKIIRSATLESFSGACTNSWLRIRTLD